MGKRTKHPLTHFMDLVGLTQRTLATKCALGESTLRKWIAGSPPKDAERRRRVYTKLASLLIEGKAPGYGGRSLDEVREEVSNNCELPATARHNLQPRRFFVGREDELKQLDATLHLEGWASVTQASLWGLGGVGKTALVLEYAHRTLELGTYPGGVWWVLAEGRPLDAMAQLAATLRKYAPQFVAAVQPDATAEDLAMAARRGLETSRERVLLVLDNVSERGFAELLPGNQVRVLLTTRDRRVAIGREARLDVLSLKDARLLAKKLGGVAKSAAEKKTRVRVLRDLLGKLAVAVEVAARAVRRWAGSWVAYEQHLLRRIEEALQVPESLSDNYPRGVIAALDASIGRCEERARRLLDGAAVFAPDGLPLSWACMAAGHELDPESIEAQRAFGELEGLGLVKVDREAGVLSTHRLVHTRVRDLGDPEAWRGLRTRAAEGVEAWLNETVGPAPEQMRVVDARRAHILAARAAGHLEAEPTCTAISLQLLTHLRYRLAEVREAVRARR